MESRRISTATAGLSRRRCCWLKSQRDRGNVSARKRGSEAVVPLTLSMVVWRSELSSSDFSVSRRRMSRWAFLNYNRSGCFFFNEDVDLEKGPSVVVIERLESEKSWRRCGVIWTAEDDEEWPRKPVAGEGFVGRFWKTMREKRFFFWGDSEGEITWEFSFSLW